MAGGTTAGDHETPLAEINVTPLVDVMVVLLVIFIIAAPLFAQALHVDLPRAAAPPSRDAVVAELAVHADGRLELDGRALPPEGLQEALAQRLAAAPELVLRIGADGGVAYRRVAELLSLAQEGGVARIAFATQAP